MTTTINQGMPDHLWRPLTQHQVLQGNTPNRIVSAKG